ncbi:MAG: alanine--tRNA ligase [Chloroflexi bacterium]|nr:alanine--tRNA ligase [Chloroflexota bacterium]
MPPTTSEEIREAFLRYFEEHQHQRVPSSSLIPYNDDTLLLTNAGMVQFKDVFLGLEKRPYTRATTAQKCMRVSGKHNDLENVGPSPRHHTFFEMLGNFSFGDYFKREAIRYAYEFLTDVMGLDPERLYYTVYLDDDDAYNFWTQEIGIDPARVYRMGEKTNFWSMGDVGPCGPTSEIHYDWGAEACTCGDPNCSVLLDNDCDRWLEVWNLVFMQFNQDAEGKRTPLPKTGVDTGMGLERIVSVVQNTPVNYDNDLFVPIMAHIQSLLGHSDAERVQHQVGYRVIADHARAAAFLIADGVRPGATGPGYVLRMVIRRAHRFGRKIGFDKPFITQVCDAVIEKMGDVYPELRLRRQWIHATVTQEEEQFIATLDRALGELEQALARLQEQGEHVLPGEIAFDLKSTHGLPFEVTRDICQERGFGVDEEAYLAADEAHRRLSQGRLNAAVYAKGAEIYTAALDALLRRGFLSDSGVRHDPYGALTRSTQLLGILVEGKLVERAEAGQEVDLILAETPFYIEAGGQVSDTGEIVGEGWRARVNDVRRPIPGLILHRAVLESGHAQVGAAVIARVDSRRRWDIMRNHTATHLLHRVLRNLLGEHVEQAGSLVAPDRLRFDFRYDAALSEDELHQITDSVNAAILANYPVQISWKPIQEALTEGATALFGEKYGDVVRTVRVGDEDNTWSYELCGGTHVENTSQIGSFFITSEGSVSAGVRRIEAVTGFGAEEYALDRIFTLEHVARHLHVPPQAVEEKVEDLQAQLHTMNRELHKLRQQLMAQQAREVVSQAEEVAGVPVIVTRVQAADVNDMRVMADDLRSKLGSGIVVLGAILNEKPMLIAAATKDVTQKGAHAGKLVKALAARIGGGGGGRPDMAQAGGRDASKLDEALAAARDEIAQQLSA